MQIYKTKKEQEPPITEITGVICEGAWIRLFEPSEDELVTIAEKCAIPPEFLKAALRKRNAPVLIQMRMWS